MGPEICCPDCEIYRCEKCSYTACQKCVDRSIFNCGNGAVDSWVHCEACVLRCNLCAGAITALCDASECSFCKEWQCYPCFKHYPNCQFDFQWQCFACQTKEWICARQFITKKVDTNLVTLIR